MENFTLGSRVRELRGQLGVSQEELSQLSGLTVRTVQRIESGQTVPRGDSLKRIANALQVNIGELTKTGESLQVASAVEMVADPKYAVIMVLSALTFLFNAVLGLALPMIIFFLYRNSNALVRKYGKEILWIESVYCLVFAIFYGYQFAFLVFRFQVTEFITYEQLLLFFMMMKVFNVLSILVILTVLVVKNRGRFRFAGPGESLQ